MKCRVHQTIMVLSCVLLAVSLAHSGPPNPTPSDQSGNTAGGKEALLNNNPNQGFSNTAFGF